MPEIILHRLNLKGSPWNGSWTTDHNGHRYIVQPVGRASYLIYCDLTGLEFSNVGMTDDLKAAKRFILNHKAES